MDADDRKYFLGMAVVALMLGAGTFGVIEGTLDKNAKLKTIDALRTECQIQPGDCRFSVTDENRFQFERTHYGTEVTLTFPDGEKERFAVSDSGVDRIAPDGETTVMTLSADHDAAAQEPAAEQTAAKATEDQDKSVKYRGKLYKEDGTLARLPTLQEVEDEVIRRVVPAQYRPR